MKYLRYIAILLMKIIGKIIGIAWYYVAVPFRGYSRNVIYNYVLQNGIYLPRLLERKPELQGIAYKLKNIRNTFYDGYIVYRKISKIEYYLVLWLLWVWVDDDSNYDTYDGTRTECPEWFGNAFDLGDIRAIMPMFDLKRATLWNFRNSFYNFNYMFEEIREDSKYNFFKVIKIFGFTTIWGFIPYTNSTRKGRLVFLVEDLDKIDEKIIKEHTIKN